jgi:cyclophilin family peptidyl-prolyl cis-trans isomerase
MTLGVSGRLCAAVASTVVMVMATACGDGPAPEEVVATVPDTFSIEFATSAGTFEVEFVREWSPVAVERVHELGVMGYWGGGKIYRVNERYAQFGYSGRPELDAEWLGAGLPDEPTQASNIRGTVSFARGGPGTRSIILFVNRSDNTDLDDLQWNGVLGFPPVGRVVHGMEVIDALHDGYGEAPLQWEDSIAVLGNAFLARQYPQLDSILAVSLSEPAG